MSLSVPKHHPHIKVPTYEEECIIDPQIFAAEEKRFFKAMVILIESLLDEPILNNDSTEFLSCFICYALSSLINRFPKRNIELKQLIENYVYHIQPHHTCFDKHQKFAKSIITETGKIYLPSHQKTLLTMLLYTKTKLDKPLPFRGLLLEAVRKSLSFKTIDAILHATLILEYNQGSQIEPYFDEIKECYALLINEISTHGSNEATGLIGIIDKTLFDERAAKIFTDPSRAIGICCTFIDEIWKTFIRLKESKITVTPLIFYLMGNVIQSALDKGAFESNLGKRKIQEYKEKLVKEAQALLISEDYEDTKSIFQTLQRAHKFC